MKQKKLILVAILTLCFLPAISYSAGPCDSANQIAIDSELDPTEQLQNYFSNPPVNEGAYCLKFDSEDEWEVFQALSITNSTSKDMYISGLKLLRRTDFDSGATPLLTVTNSSNKNVYISNLIMGSVKVGLKIAKTSTGSISVADASITGDSSKSGSCLIANASGALITGGEFTNCSNGIKVSSNNVNISDADIHENKYGVYVDAGITGTDVENTLIYANDSGLNASDRRQDGIFFADEPRDLVFYGVVDGAAVNLSDTSSVAFNYGSRTPYIVLPEMPDTGSQVELYISQTTGSECGYQACVRADEGARLLAIDAGEVLAAGITDVTLPASLRNQNLVAVYKHPELGVTSISKVFSFANELPGDIAFVATPYDIPTSGGNVGDSGPGAGSSDSGSDDEEAQSGSDSGSGSGTQMASGEGGSLDVGNLTDSVGAAADAKCSLMVGDTFRSVSIVTNLWWIIFATGLLGGLRMVMVKIRRR